MIMNTRNAENTALRPGGQMSPHEYLEQLRTPRLQYGNSIQYGLDYGDGLAAV